MDPLVWHKAAAVSGILAVGLGAFGAHGFKPKDSTYKQVWQTASVYHLMHTAALLAAPITKYPNTFGGLMTAGIVLFSGSLTGWCSIVLGLGTNCLCSRCYAVALLEDRKYSKLAPVGGFAFIAGWATLLF